MVFIILAVIIWTPVSTIISFAS